MWMWSCVGWSGPADARVRQRSGSHLVLYQHLLVFDAASRHSFVGINITIPLISFRINKIAISPRLFQTCSFVQKKSFWTIETDTTLNLCLQPAMNDNYLTWQKDQVIWKWIK